MNLKEKYFKMKLNKETLLSCGAVDPQKLSNECLMVQLFGLKYCDLCEAKNTRNCGGKKIRQTGKNKAGVKVPL